MNKEIVVISIVVGIIFIAVLLACVYELTYHTEMREKCEDLCEFKQMNYFRNSLNDRTCVCLNQDNEIKEFGIK